MWKLGLNNFLPSSTSLGPNSYYTRYGFHLAYERKLRDPAWSVLAEVSPALARYRPEFSLGSRQRLSMRVQAAGRHYYNQQNRLRRGRNVGNFSANYVSVALGTGLRKESHEMPFFFYQNTERRFLATDGALLYGWQRRLGHYGFVDANVDVAAFLASKPAVSLAASVRIGLTLGPQSAKYARQLAPASEVTTL